MTGGAEWGKVEQSSDVTAGKAAVAVVVSPFLGKVGSACVTLGRGEGSQASLQAQAQASAQRECEGCHGNCYK